MSNVTIRRRLRASAERIFKAWTEPAQLKAWHCPEGMSVSQATCDPRVGGSYLITMVDDEANAHTVSGRYLEIVPNRKLVFTWEWVLGGDPAVGSIVTILLKTLASDETELTLVHEGLTDGDSRDSHESGWTGALNQLLTHVTNEHPTSCKTTNNL